MPCTPAQHPQAAPPRTFLGPSLRVVLLGLSLLASACASLGPQAGRYRAGGADNPVVLELRTDGSYLWGRASDAGTDRIETGRWMRLQGRIVVLIPARRTDLQWFAKVESGRSDGGLHYSSRLRDLLESKE